MKKLIIVVLATLMISAVLFTNATASCKEVPYNPIVSKRQIEIVSRTQFIKRIVKSENISYSKALKYDAEMTKKFEQTHPDLFRPIKTYGSTSGHYEYAYISRYVYFGYTYGGNYIEIRQTVPVKIYVYGSFRSFVYAQNPFTQSCSGGYTWYQSYNHTDLGSPPTQFTALSSGYAEVTIDSSLALSIGIELVGNGFSLTFTQGSTYYYRKICDFPVWTYNLYP